MNTLGENIIHAYTEYSLPPLLRCSAVTPNFIYTYTKNIGNFFFDSFLFIHNLLFGRHYSADITYSYNSLFNSFMLVFAMIWWSFGGSDDDYSLYTVKTRW